MAATFSPKKKKKEMAATPGPYVKTKGLRI